MYNTLKMGGNEQSSGANTQANVYQTPVKNFASQEFNASYMNSGSQNVIQTNGATQVFGQANQVAHPQNSILLGGATQTLGGVPQSFGITSPGNQRVISGNNAGLNFAPQQGIQQGIVGGFGATQQLPSNVLTGSYNGGFAAPLNNFNQGAQLRGSFTQGNDEFS